MLYFWWGCRRNLKLIKARLAQSRIHKILLHDFWASKLHEFVRTQTGPFVQLWKSQCEDFGESISYSKAGKLCLAVIWGYWRLIRLWTTGPRWQKPSMLSMMLLRWFTRWMDLPFAWLSSLHWVSYSLEGLQNHTKSLVCHAQLVLHCFQSAPQEVESSLRQNHRDKTACLPTGCFAWKSQHCKKSYQDLQSGQALLHR